jgi:hypothetical protein
MTIGTGRRDESVQFSLKELLKLEDERLEEQTRERQAREAATVREREENERRRRAEAEAQARAEAEAREQRNRIELDELARREAMQKALVEQSRVEVEARTRADERERERQHELAIERLRSESKTGTSIGSLAFAAALGGGVMLVVALGVQLGVVKPAAERRIAQLEQSVTIAEGKAQELGRRIDEQQRTIGERDRQLADAQSEINALKAKRPASPSGPTPGLHRLGPSPATTTQAPQQDCLKGDPMCYSLKPSR